MSDNIPPLALTITVGSAAWCGYLIASGNVVAALAAGLLAYTCGMVAILSAFHDGVDSAD